MVSINYSARDQRWIIAGELDALARQDHPTEAHMYMALLEAFTRSIAPGYGRVALW